MTKKIIKNTKDLSELKVLKSDLEILNDENRLRILYLLRNKKELCVCEIFERLKIPQNLSSYHLTKLKKSDFLKSKKVGVKVIYSLNLNKIKDFSNIINKLIN